MTGEHWKTRLWWSVRRTVKWANTVVEMLWAIVMLHSALRYKEKLISSQAWWGSRQWKEILLQDRQYVEQQRDRHGTGRINSSGKKCVGLEGTGAALLVTGGGVTHPFNPDPRVVASGVWWHCCTTLSPGQWPTGYQSQSLKYVIVLLPCPPLSVLASRHFFPAITVRNSSLCDGLNVWPFLAFWHCQPESSLIIYKAEN